MHPHEKMKKRKRREKTHSKMIKSNCKMSLKLSYLSMSTLIANELRVPIRRTERVNWYPKQTNKQINHMPYRRNSFLSRNT